MIDIKSFPLSKYTLKDEDTILEYLREAPSCGGQPWLQTDHPSFGELLILLETPYYMWGSNTHPAYWIGFPKDFLMRLSTCMGAFYIDQLIDLRSLLQEKSLIADLGGVQKLRRPNAEAKSSATNR